MANGKKQYVISPSAYGLNFIERNRRFRAHFEKMAAREPSKQQQSARGATLDSSTRQKETAEFFNSLQRSDKFLEDLSLIHI